MKYIAKGEDFFRNTESIEDVKDGVYKVFLTIDMTQEELKDAKTIKAAIDRNTDFLDDVTLEEFEERWIDSEWIDICADGVVIWYDGV